MKKAKALTTLLIFVVVSLASYLGLDSSPPTAKPVQAQRNGPIEDYEAARKVFWQQLYADGGTTLYCGETFPSKKHIEINIEHVFPMSWVAWALKCGERQACRKTSVAFNTIEADLHNLFPARKDINSDRRSHPFGYVDGEPRNYGRCDFEVDQRKKIVEPREEVRGDIARAMFYMADRYQLEIRAKQYRTLKQWHRQDPVSRSEMDRNQAIKRLQGNTNPYIDGKPSQ